jgi:hypothetical protein
MKNDTKISIMKQFLEYLENVSDVNQTKDWDNIKELVLEAEKQQIGDAYIAGQFRNMFGGGQHWKEYFNQTYNNEKRY